MLLAAITLDWTVILVALLGGGFFVGLTSMLRLRVDKGAVVIQSAQGAVVVQTAVIDALRKEISRLEEDVQELRLELQTERSIRLELEKQRNEPSTT